MSQTCIGWILDVYFEYDQVVLWVKNEIGKGMKLVADYCPSFFLLPKNEKSGSELVRILSDLGPVKKVKWDYKFTDINEKTMQKLIYVECYSIHHYNLLLKALQHETLRQRIQQTYNSKLSHIQRYIFDSLPTNPMTKSLFEHDDGYLISITPLNDSSIEIPYSVMNIDITPTYGGSVIDGDDPIRRIEVGYENNVTAFNGHESELLEQFSKHVTGKDPDIITFNYDNNLALSYIFQRIKSLALDLAIGRRLIDMYSNENRIVEKWSQGRVYLHRSQIEKFGLKGLLELSQFSYLPIRMVLDYSIGRLISTRIVFELLSRQHVISDSNSRKHYEKIRTVEEIIEKDKAGMIFTPHVGLHENVAVLDFNDEFANIIVNQNISYEQRDKLPGILPQIVKCLIGRRVYFRNLLKQLSESANEATQYKNRADCIKQILVCLYGTTASYWNKYGNISTFEAINKKSREILLKTKDLVQQFDYELIYADVDSAFVHKENATRDDYEKLQELVSKETGMNLSLEYYYKYLVLLPLEADEKLEALKHYFGITYDGELIMRGIETRRHDAPKYIKDFQTELLYTLFDCDKLEDIQGRTLENALLLVTRTIDKVMIGEIEIEDLVISKQLRMGITKYKSIFPHVAAAIQFTNANGRPPAKGKMIQYVYTDSQHQNPINRVAIADGSLENIEYDREKYKEVLLDAAETVLGIFGFDRTLYGKPKEKKWWMELKRSRTNDIDAESRQQNV